MKLLPAADLDRLLVELEVDIVTLSECGISPEWRLAFPEKAVSAIHYNLSGTGQLFIGNLSPINLTPHTLVIIPAMMSCQISAPPSQCVENASNTEQFTDDLGKISKQFAGSGEPAVRVICGYIRATYGNSIDIFKTLTMPIIERFDETNGLDENLKMALAELVVQEVGMRAMTAALLKRVLVTILRRSIKSAELWTERFPILSDPQIARALVAMLTDPTAAHSVNSLSSTAGLSRSAFMARFTRAIGLSPLAALKRLRMREAARLLAASALQIDQIANLVGYASRSSFSRAFRSIYATDPSDYRTDNRARAIRKGSMKKESGKMGDSGHLSGSHLGEIVIE
jgi:AraC family transcriptional activator of mtrCDE